MSIHQKEKQQTKMLLNDCHMSQPDTYLFITSDGMMDSLRTRKRIYLYENLKAPPISEVVFGIFGETREYTCIACMLYAV